MTIVVIFSIKKPCKFKCKLRLGDVRVCFELLRKVVAQLVLQAKINKLILTRSKAHFIISSPNALIKVNKLNEPTFISGSMFKILHKCN